MRSLSHPSGDCHAFITPFARAFRPSRSFPLFRPADAQILASNDNLETVIVTGQAHRV